MAQNLDSIIADFAAFDFCVTVFWNEKSYCNCLYNLKLEVMPQAGFLGCASAPGVVFTQW